MHGNIWIKMNVLHVVTEKRCSESQSISVKEMFALMALAQFPSRGSFPWKDSSVRTIWQLYKPAGR